MNDLGRRIGELSPAKLELLTQKLKAADADSSKQRITCRSVAGTAAPLTFAQQRLWFLAQLQPSSTAYNMNLAMRLTGPLHLAALEQSLNEVMRRHEALRTSFAASHGKPIQVIAPQLHFTLRVVDNTTVAEDFQAAEIERRAIAQAQQPFDLREAPLLRMSLLRFAEEDHVVLFTIHHIISDAWSLNLLTLEMAKLYEAFRHGNSSPLPPLPIQYADFAVWQREALQRDVLQAQLDYWREQLADAPFVLDLPTDRPHVAVQNLRGATQSFLLDKSLTEALIQLSQRENVTLFMTLLAVFQTLLYRYTRQEDILVGTPIAGRNRIETAEIIESEIRVSRKLQSPPIRPITRDQELPLSYAQQRLWFSTQLEPNNPVYNISAAVRLTGNLNIAALEQTLNEIVRRHEVLRTNFPVVGQRPVQAIAPHITMTLRLNDLSALPVEKREAEAQRRAREEAECLFDLSHGPLLRAKLLRLSEAEHIALLTMHHIVSDRWSMNLLIGEVTALYGAFSTSQPSPLPELPIQYADFAVWQREWLRGEVLESQLAYWKRQLLGAPPLFSLPTDRPRAVVQSFQSARHSVGLSKELSLELKELARREGVTLFMVLVAAVKTLLCYCTGERDAIVGTDVANRNRAETEGLIGFFVNQLVLRTRLRGETDFRHLLKEVREIALEAYAHQDVPFEKLVEAIKPERMLKHTPLFQVKLNLHNFDAGRLALPELELSALKTANEALDLDLMFVLAETAAGLNGWICYKTELFDADRIVRLKTHFEFLLETIAQSPLITINELWQSLAEMDQKEKTLRHIEREELKLKRFKSIKPIPVNLTLADN